jgi:hypothetical protein
MRGQKPVFTTPDRLGCTKEAGFLQAECSIPSQLKKPGLEKPGFYVPDLHSI